MILRDTITDPSNFRATKRLDAWLKSRNIIGLSGLDTRALTAMIREKGMPNAVIAHAPDGIFNRAALAAEAKAWPGIDGMDLVPDVTAAQRYDWDQTSWTLEKGYGRREGEAKYKVVAIDYGVKRNILRLLDDPRAPFLGTVGHTAQANARHLDAGRTQIGVFHLFLAC